ncbi:hypothetical protein HYS93_03940 [Candidatus Daviesbacteria bacterium]|nr:hypothetical protein [Candidatus Daviesbacteria bacterium]
MVAALAQFKIGKIDDDSVRNFIVPHGGDVRNTIAGRTLVKGETRSYIEEKVERYTDEVKAAFENALKQNGENRIKLRFDKVRENGGFKYSEDDPFVLSTKEL